MKKIFLFFLLFLVLKVDATPIIVTPVEEISTSTKNFQLGNCYNFRNVQSNEIYQGKVIYYRPNGMLGQEAQVEISNFVDSKNREISGKITIIPNNHKKFQEFMNYFSMAAFNFVRGSEICLKPDVHQFILDNDKSKKIIVLIKPAQEINTCYDELEISDVVEFSVIENVYKNGSLYIKSGTPIFGIIDSIDENGWCADNARIYFKEFRTNDIRNNKVTISADLTIDGFEILKYKSDKTKQFFNYLLTFIRGKEVDIKATDVDIKFIIISSY